MKQFKRILCMLLVFTFILGMMPMSVFAEENDTESEASEAATENVSEAEPEPPLTGAENSGSEASETGSPAPGTDEDTGAVSDDETNNAQPAPTTVEEPADGSGDAPESGDDPADGNGDAPESGDAPADGNQDAPESGDAPADENEDAPENGDDPAPAEAEDNETVEDPDSEDEAEDLASEDDALNPDEAVDPMARGDKLTYNANAGGDAVTGMPNAQAANDDSTVYVSTNIPSRAGYTFLGWASDPSAAEAEYYPGQKLTLDGDLTLYAVWQKSATLSYNGNGADTEVPASETNVAGWIALAAAAPARDGYRFDGWLGSDGITYQPGDEVEVTFPLVVNDRYYGGMIIITIEEGKFEVSLELEEGFVLDEDAFYALFTDAENIDVEDENVKHYEFDTEYVIADELPDVTDIILYVSASATYDGNPAALKLFDANTEDNVKIVTDMMELIGK